MSAAREHPAPDRLAAFVRGELEGAARREILRHLLAGCRLCRRRAAALTAPLFDASRRPPPAGGLDAYEQPLRRAARAVVGIADRPSDRARSSVRGRPMRPAPATGRALPGADDALAEAERWAARARSLALVDPRRATVAAALAVRLAEASAERADPRGHAADLSARGWALLANGRRLSGDLLGAEFAFARALEAIDRGTGDLAPLAELAELAASLEKDGGRAGGAIRLLDRVIAAYAALGERHRAGRASILRGLALGELGELRAAIEQIVAGHAMLEAGREARLGFVVVHALATFLVDAGLFAEAAVVLETARPLYADHGDAIERLEARWLEARVEAARGRRRRAEALFDDVSGEFLERRMPYLGALAAIERSELWVRAGRWAEARVAIAGLIETLRGLEVRREALAALLLLERALDEQRATTKLVARIGSRLARFARADRHGAPARW